MKKKFRFRDLPVRNKLYLFSSCLLIVTIIVAAAGLEVVSLTNRAHTSRYNNYGEGQIELSDAFSNFNEVKVHLRNMLYLYADDEARQQSEIESINKAIEDANDNLNAFAQKLDQYDVSVAQTYEECVAYIDEYEASVERAVSYVSSGQIEEGRTELLTTGVTSANNAENKFDIVMADMKEASIEASDLIETQISGLRIIVIAICAVSIVIASICCIILIKSITGPVNKLSEASKKLEVGDVDVDCKKINDDDLGALMDNFANMATAIREQARIAEVISQGDLTIKVEPRGEKDILGKALQRLVSDNNITLGHIKESTMQVTLGAEQVANASQALAQGSTEQASAIEEVTASMDEIAERTKANATEAAEANSLVHSVKDMAVDGNGQMKSMIEAMNDINESSQTISKIIKVIDDIAFQTNILALNAAVEAARAGEHGKGFAVVAEEVRNLAAKSASAASETAEMIEDSIRKVGNGTQLAETTAKSLDEIVERIDKVATIINEIAVVSNDQATAISQIDQAIGQVSTVVQTNSATSEQCAAASEEMSNQAANLRKLMANYKLTAGMQNGYMNGISGNTQNAAYSASEYNNTPVISLDGDMGKY